MIAALKFVHIAGLTAWCAALIALPLLMQAHGHARRERQFIEFRLVTHVGYVAIATPAALIAIAAGTGLIFAAGVYEPWLYAKLVFVAGMVLVHAWIGHLIQRSGEELRSDWSGGPIAGLVLALPMMIAVLALVLIKPQGHVFQALVPDLLLAPRDVGEGSR